MSRIVTHNDNFPCVGCDESDFHLSSTTWNSNFGSSSYPYNNLKDGSSSSNYARITIDKTRNAESYLYLMFDFSEIPNTANNIHTNGQYTQTDDVQVKSSGQWGHKHIKKVYWRINGQCVETDEPMSGRTMFNTQ